MRLRKVGSRATVAIIVLLAGLVSNVQPATATVAVATTKSAPVCETTFGTRVPVLMVHGWKGNPTAWQSLDGALKKMDGLFTGTFNYEAANKEWVTDEKIAPALAERIHCLAQASKKAGGIGKVIVVAHSMGGLATREAADRTFDRRKVSDEMGLVITVGTPHKGSPSGNIMSWIDDHCSDCAFGSAVHGLAQGSQELDVLPEFPDSLPVKAIAGNVTERNVLLFGVITRETNSDLVVPVVSAVDEYTSTSRGDGERVFACEGVVVVFSVTNAPCEHNALLLNADVQDEVKRSIEQYLATVPKNDTPRSSKCLSVPEANKLLIKKIPDVGLRLDDVDCEGDSAIATGQGDGVALYYKLGRTWFFYDFASDWTESKACDDMPPGILERLNGC